MTTKELRRLLTATAIFSCGMFVFGYWAGNKHCEENPTKDYCPAPRIEKVEIPVNDSEVLSKFLDCRRDLIEVSEAFNSSINCHSKMCE